MDTPDKRARRREYLKAWRAANPEKVRAQEQRYRERHPDRVAEQNRQSRERLGPAYWRNWQQERKAEIVKAYGGLCQCCGETELAFLSLDHVNGGGRQERLALGNSGAMKVVRDALPELLPGYRVLCMNCQFGTMHGRICPHQT